ncbi:hypothetical protein PIB30_046579 [Stylosanthes scabra]|uniref:Uncharacterized protein n=1 Tax=Stylosanthes scabra TaxID=79078 RepID=A0ABU6YFB9_9FABA|nr:hypothetical protein [Stylosanthes scabra]
MGDLEFSDNLGRKFLHQPKSVFWFIDNEENAFRIQFKKHDSRISLDRYDISVVMRCCKPEQNAIMYIEYLNWGIFSVIIYNSSFDDNQQLVHMRIADLEFNSEIFDSYDNRGPSCTWQRFNENAYRFKLTDNMGDLELLDYLGRKFLHQPHSVFWFIDNEENADA